MIISAGYLWFGSLVSHEYVHIVHGGLVAVFLIVCGLIYKLSLKPVEQEIIPDGKVSVKNFFQMMCEALYGLISGPIPHNTEKYFPVLAAVFIYIFFSNLMGVIPGFLPPTENMATGLSVGLVVFFYYHYVGMRAQGVKNYWAHFLGPDIGNNIGMLLLRFGFIGPLIFIIEIISHSVRPISLSLRLFGNINGDHLVLGVFNGLVPLLVPIVFLAFGIFVSLVQAFVYTLLSSIYIGMAVEVHDDHH